MKNLITAFLFTVLTVVAVAQNSEKAKAIDYLNSMGEVYFKIITDNPAIVLREIGNVVSVDRVDNVSIDAYANKEQFDDFLKTGLQFSVITPASMLHAPEMTDKNNLREIYDWDKPLRDNLLSKNAKEINDLLCAIYISTKCDDAYIEFAFATGEIPIRSSMLVGFNNFTDISLHYRYENICGYTQEDIETSFLPYLKNTDLEYLKNGQNRLF